MERKVSTDAHTFNAPRSTGIPPHIAIMIKIENVPQRVLQGADMLLEDKGVAAGNITKNDLLQTLEGFVQQMRASMTRQEKEQQTEKFPFQTFLLEGSFHRLPEGFHLPQCNLLTATYNH
jgi:hypothetical protein